MNKIEEFLGLQSGGLKEVILDASINILLAIIILVIGFWIAKIISKAFIKILEARKTEESLVTFLGSLTTVLIKVLVIISAVTQLGVEMTSFVALLGAAGLAIGMAFSGTLSNFAGGVMILLFKPFKVGDLIETQGEIGVVDEILIFNTILKTTDSKTVILPNGTVANGTIVNFTKSKKRRVDWSFGIAYGDDLKTAKELLSKFIKEDSRILQKEENFIGLGQLGDSSVNITVRAWVKTDDYWNVFFDMNERVYNEFSSAGLSIPFPQMDVHLKNSEA